MDAILDWPVPKSVNAVRQNVGLTNFYQPFIKRNAMIVQPISDIVRFKQFPWSKGLQIAFENFKQALTAAPALAHLSFDKTIVISTDVFKYAVGTTLEQDGHSVAYLFHRLSEAEVKRDTDDQKLLALMIAVVEMRIYIRGRRFIFRIDHKPLRYLQSKGRQNGWIDILHEHVYDVGHILGKQHVVPDALSRRPDHQPAASMRSMFLKDPSFPARIKSK